MTLRPSLPWLLTTLAVALVAMFLAAGAVRKVESAIVAAIFALLLVATAIRTNAPIWRRETSLGRITPRDALIETTRLIMLAFLWCALAFYAIYLGTNIRWQHGWEYGSANLLIAGAYGYYLWRLTNPSDGLSSPLAIERMVKLAGYQAVLIGVGLVWLIGSGKLATHKGDWAANQLFLAGGFAIMCLSVILIKANAVLTERRAAN